MSSLTTLDVTPRTSAGTGSARACRREGMVPAVMYGRQFPALMFALSGRALDKEIRKGGFFSRLYSFTVEGKNYRAVARDIQFHPVTDIPLHVDFVRVEPGSHVTVSVPVVLLDQATSPGLKKGGVLNFVSHSVQVSCPVDAIPDHVEISLGQLDIHGTVHIRDIVLPEGARALENPDHTVLTIVAPRLAQESAAAPAEAASAS
jgi:large subunit ribosomal protein L25